MAAIWRQNSNFYQKYLFHTMSYYNSHPDIKIYLELILSLVAVIALGVLAIKPTLVTIAELNSELAQKQEVDNTLEQKINDLSTAQQVINQNRSTLDLLDTAVPTSPQVDAYIKQLEALALQDGVLLTNLQFSSIALIGSPIQSQPATPIPEEATPSATQSQGQSDIPLSITVSGEYPALMAFLKNLEDLRRPIAIDAVNSNSFTTEGTQTLQLIISGKIPYYYVQNQPVTNEEQ